MAKDKKSIIVYADWIDKFEELDDAEAGRLIKHFFRYVNDLNPEYPDRITKLSFIDIEKSLKRDLKKWESTLEGRSKAGKASAEARRLLKESEQNSTKVTSVDFVKQNSTNPTDNVNDNDNDNVNDNVNDIFKTQNKNDFFLAELLNSEDWLNITAMQSLNKYRPNEIKEMLQKHNAKINASFDFKPNKKEYCTHFINWLNKQQKQSGPTKKRIIS